MALKYRTHPELGVFVTAFPAVVTDDKVITAYKELFDSSPDHACFNQLADWRAIETFDVSSRMVEKIAQLGSMHRVNRNCVPKTAHLVSNKFLYGMSRMYGGYAWEKGEKVMPFYDVDEALRWLGLQGIPPDTLIDL